MVDLGPKANGVIQSPIASDFSHALSGAVGKKSPTTKGI
jgi:hypothetical protein